MNNLRTLTHAYSQTPWRRQIQWIGAFLLALVVVWLIAAIYLDVTARAAAIGIEIRKLQIGQGLTIGLYDDIAATSEAPSIEELEQRIVVLQYRLAQITADETMRKRAVALGYQPLPPDQVLYIEVDGYIPPQTAVIAPAPAAVAAQPQSPRPVIRESMVQWLVNQFIQAGELLQEP